MTSVTPHLFPRALFVLCRLVFGAFCFCTSFYCLVAYVPFTYHNIIEFNVVGWVGLFAVWHPYLYWLAFACALISIAGDFGGRGRWLAVGFAGGGAAVGAWLLLNPLLAHLRNDVRSLYWAAFSLVPIVWLAAVDCVGHLTDLEWSEADPREDRHIFSAACLAAASLSATYLAIGYLRARATGPTALSVPDLMLSALWGLAGHLLVFAVVGSTLALVRGLAGWFRVPGRVEFLLCSVVGALAAAFAMKSVVLAGLSMSGPLVTVLAATYGAAIVAFTSASAIQIARQRGVPLRNGVDAALTLVTAVRPRAFPLRLLALAVVAVAAYAATVNAAALDWNFLFQKVIAIAVWVLSFSIAYARPYRPDAVEQRAAAAPASSETAFGDLAVLFVIPLAVVLGYRTLDARPALVSGIVPGPDTNVAGALDRYAGYDASFKLIRDTLRPRPRPATSEDKPDAGDYYAFLQKNTNIPRTIRIEPTDVQLAPDGAPSGLPKPHIFIIVIDSLRQDYVGPYNPKVAFTPAIDRFARDSVVFTRAFTRYGATGPSEPSIWVGGMLPHQQYVTPFEPMNSLEKLLHAEGYQSFISRDTILQTIVKADADVVDLDRNVASKDLELCRSLGELSGRLQQRGGDARPVFAYTQPQNIHVAAITREGASVPSGESYPGFYAPYASRIRRMDTCFGEFVSSLQQQGLYQNSVVILTSDHGDSLGEDGRWGHAYTLFPEILRIPLIVHLPDGLRRTASDSGPAFLTDITPTLYDLLGRRPTMNHELFGRSLLNDLSTGRPPQPRDRYLVASSYGPTYGVLGGDGRSLYLVDATNYRDYYFDLGTDPAGRENLISPDVRREYEPIVRKGVDAIGRFYRIPGD